MDDRVKAALARARAVLEVLPDPLVAKTIWSSPAGKKKLSKRLAALLPGHKTYVEPFAGSAAVFFAKEPAEVEVLNDADEEIMATYRLIKRLTREQLAQLGKMSWTGDRDTFHRQRAKKPANDVEALYRFLYLTHFSYGKLRGKSFSPSQQGVTSQITQRIEQHAPRLKHVRLHTGDYEDVVRKYDSSTTVLFLDPPYPGYDVRVGESEFDEERFFKVLTRLKGKFLLTYGIRGKLPELLKGSNFNIKRIRTPRTIRTMRGVGGSTVLTQLLVANYEADWGPPAVSSQQSAPTSESALKADSRPLIAGSRSEPFAKTAALIKGLDPNDERYVLGIVLEPEVVDAQGDIYSAEEIRQAAHRFMEEFGGLGLMHTFRVNGEVKVLESYLAPTDFSIGDVAVRKGTWLLAVRVLSDALWEQVKNGELTGFSIGGSARRIPESTDESQEVRNAA